MCPFETESSNVVDILYGDVSTARSQGKNLVDVEMKVTRHDFTRNALPREGDRVAFLISFTKKPATFHSTTIPHCSKSMPKLATREFEC